MKRLAMKLARLSDMSVAELKEAWTGLSNDQVPSLPVPLLRRLVAQRMQEKRHGGLPRPAERELERVATGAAPAAPVRRSAPLSPGTRLVRDWNGRTIIVEVEEDGSYLWEGRSYRSLSLIAREVTGAHWSGPRFFGLRRRG